MTEVVFRIELMTDLAMAVASNAVTDASTAIMDNGTVRCKLPFALKPSQSDELVRESIQLKVGDFDWAPWYKVPHGRQCPPQEAKYGVLLDGKS